MIGLSLVSYRQWMERALADLDLANSNITVEVAERQSDLPFHHRDPFDRLLVAPCVVDSIPLVSTDPVFDRYGVNRVWD